jgi:hypothetical protein
MTKIYNLALGGTGLDGSAYVGALRQFQRISNNSIGNIKRVVGSSTGGIVAMMIALGYTINEIERIWHEDFTVHKLENPRKGPTASFDGDRLGILIDAIIKNKTGNKDFTFGELDPKKGYKQLYIITMMMYLQKNIPKTSCHVFSQKHTGKTKISDAVLATASIPGMYPIIFLNKIEESHWIKGDDYHQIPRGFDSIPLEEFFDKKEYLSEIDEKSNLDIFTNFETLCFITHDNVSSTARWKPIPKEHNNSLLYALSEASKEDLMINEKSSRSPRKKFKRTVLITVTNPITYGSEQEKNQEATAAETAVREHFMMKSIEEEKKSEASSSKSARSRLTGLFSKSPPASAASIPAASEIKPEDKPEKSKKCVIM